MVHADYKGLNDAAQTYTALAKGQAHLIVNQFAKWHWH